MKLREVVRKLEGLLQEKWSAFLQSRFLDSLILVVLKFLKFLGILVSLVWEFFVLLGAGEWCF